jgi:pseudouridylate synthase
MSPAANPHLALSPEVRDAIASGHPVVALESTIITHGMPWPENAATARLVEQDIRREGAIPATIAIMDGKLKVGLTDADIARLGQDASVHKASRRDIAAFVASGQAAGTTVAATMLIAEIAGIAVFATGGIGGVHRGAETSFDISADIEELARTPVCVVCAGAKSILDLPKTLEALETRGVPVWGFGVDELPAFFSRSSGLRLDRRFDAPSDIASALKVQRALGLRQGVLVCNPPPAELALPRSVMDDHVGRAIAEARAAGIRGKDETPFLLKRINELTGGRSLEVNVALIRSNAGLAARIAHSLA